MIGGISFLSPSRATRTISAPSSGSAMPRAFRSATISGMSGSASLSPFHRSKVTPRLAHSRSSPTRVTVQKCRHSAR